MPKNKLDYRFRRVYNTPLAVFLSFALAAKLIYYYVVDLKAYAALLENLANFEDILKGKRMSVLLNIESLSDEQVEILSAEIMTLASKKRFPDDCDN